MTVAELDAVNAILRQYTGQITTADWTSRRTQSEQTLSTFPIMPGIGVAEARVGGVPGLWFDRSGVARNKVLLYFHGGGYCIGSPTGHRSLVSLIASHFDGRVFSADYRLAPEFPYPAAVRDAEAAYEGLLADGIAPAAIAVAGDSAGGGLALALLQSLRDRGRSLPAAGWGLSPWTDLTGSGDTMRTKAENDLMVSRSTLMEFAQAYAPGRQGEALASPLFGALHGLPPLLLQAGTAETLLDDATRFAAKASAADVSCRFESWPGMPHVFHAFWPMLSEARDAVADACTWLNARLAGA